MSSNRDRSGNLIRSGIQKVSYLESASAPCKEEERREADFIASKAEAWQVAAESFLQAASEARPRDREETLEAQTRAEADESLDLFDPFECLGGFVWLASASRPRRHRAYSRDE